MASFLEKNKDFVLKLKITTAGGQTQIRRVSLPRIADRSGKVSYEELVGLVIDFSVPGQNAATVATSPYTVSLTYYDDEKDLITLASTEELVDAIELFAAQKFMRITTSVKPKTSYSSTRYRQDAVAPPLRNQGASANGEDENYPPSPPIRDVLESFAGILSSAVNNLQEGLASQDCKVPPSNTRKEKPSAANAVGRNNRGRLRAANRARLNGVSNNLASRKLAKDLAKGVNSGKANEASSDLARKNSSSCTSRASNKVGPDTTSSDKPEEPEEPFVHERHTCDGCLTTPIIGKRYHSTNIPDYDLCQTCFDNYRGNTIQYEEVQIPGRKKAPSCTSRASNVTTTPSGSKVGPATTSSGSSDKAEASEEPEEPFIHGRHTCDGCLITPIIGKRYHSTNLPDYDLCQRCFDNYKGNEIKYEPTELPRDIPFQDRWRRRHQMASNMKQRRMQHARGNRVPHPAANRGSVARPSSFQAASNVGALNTSNPTSPPEPSAPSDFDTALKEAIRRSLDDVVPKEASTKEVSPTKEAPADEDPSTKEASTKVESASKEDSSTKASVKEDLQTKEAPVKEDPQTKEASLEEDSSTKETSVKKDPPTKEASTKEDPPTKTNDSVEMNNKSPDEASSSSNKAPLIDDKVSEIETDDPKGDIPRSVDIVEQETDDADQLTYNGDATVNTELKNVEAMQDAMETESCDSEKLLSEPMGQGVLSANMDEGFESHSSPFSKRKGSDVVRDESFALEAVGNGDVAELMAKTLDMVADAVTEMLSDESQDVEEPNEDGKVSDSESNEGELIVNSSDDVASVEEEEDDADADWSVVKSIGSNGTTESQRIGKATEMLGSALFNSDMKNSAENNSSDSFSIPSSVPTELGTVHSRAAAQSKASRWSTELEKLRELGFDNEENCIEILERIGAESNSIETNLEQVVNELLLLNA